MFKLFAGFITLTLFHIPRMAASDWYKRQKEKLKRALRPQDQSSFSSPESSHAQPPSSPVPPSVEKAANNPVKNAPKPLAASSSLDGPSHQSSNPQPVDTASLAAPLPNLGIDHLSVPTVDRIVHTAPEDVKEPKEQSNKMEWFGLKMLSNVIKSGAATFGPLESAIGGLEQCIDILERASKIRGDYREIAEKLDQLLEDLAAFNSKWMEEAMTTSVRNLCSGINMEIKTIEKRERSAPGKYLEVTEDSDAIIECYRRIHGHVERLILNANLNMWKTLDEEMTDRRLFQLSPTMSGAYNSWAADRVKRRQCTEGTRVQELERLKTWVRDPSSSPIYWINGTAGTGKTTIAYTLCSEFEAAGELAASFFCTRLIPECRNVQLILPAIAYQLAQFSLPFRHAVSKSLDSDRMAHTRELGLQFQSLIAHPLNVVRRTMPSSFVVVIDALDECEDRDSIENILDLFVTSATDLPIRFLVSSRPEPEIYRRMMDQIGGNPNAKLVLHGLDPSDVRQDIETYLRRELHNIPLRTEQWSGLIERCGVLFIYASTACRYIKSSDETMNYEEALDTILGVPLEDTENMEKELDKLYIAILETAFKRPQISEVNRKRMKAILDTIVCAQEPITTETLAALLGLKNPDHISSLLRPLFSVVNVAEDTRIATTLHGSFPDFIFSPDRSASFHCAATQHHITLTLACLEQIKSNPVQFNICDIESSYLLDDDISDLPERANRTISSALYYSCCHWASHLELCGSSVELREPVFNFLSTRLLIWLEVLNAKKFPAIDVNSAMKKIRNWCQAEHSSHDVTELVEDANRFCVDYVVSGVSESTAHIYTSMLPFQPSTSLIVKHYAPQLSAIPQPVGAAISRRYFPQLAERFLGQPMHAMCYYPSAAYIATAVGNKIYILDGSTLQTALGPLEGHSDLVTSITISPDGLYIASGSCDATIRIWNAQSGALVTGPIKAHRDRVASVAFSPDSTRIVSAGVFDALHVWLVQNGELLVSTTPTGEDPDCVQTAVFSTDGSRIISCDGNRVVCSWDSHTGSLISRRIAKHAASIDSVSLSPNGSRFASASVDGTICVWDTEFQHIVLGPLKKRGGDIIQVAFSPNDLYIASSANDSRMHIWDATTGESIATLFEGYGVSIRSFVFSPDSSRIVSSTNEGSIYIWDIQYAVKFDTMIRKDGKGIHSACFSSDGSQIVTGGRGGNICLWDTSSGELVMGPLTGHKGYICSVAISSDGAYIASASRDKTIRLWDVKGGRGIYRILDHHTKGPECLRFSHDNSELFFGSLVYIIGASPFDSKISPIPNTNARDTWAGEVLSDNVSCIATSLDGLYVASGSADGTVRMWHAQTGRLILGPIHGHTQPVSVIMFSPKGMHFASCSLDDTTRFWRIPSQSGCKAVGSHSAGTIKGSGIAATNTVPWTLNKNGWIVSNKNEHLAWIPLDLRPYLILPQNDLLISLKGSFKIDFTDTNIGKLWKKSYCPA
ncbi:unnamed protein product [Rhizoctonia solani]|uniref:NACHT domain-containing protein n=1 Tax=Rhizoctonia solani TaxID=456999 RepID=A0A8H3GTY3_9AGAM|nr:unnamed protein product [Rhizoctonia solani]